MVSDFFTPVRKLQTLVHHAERVWCLAWNHAGSVLASCGEDRSVCLWVAEHGSWRFAFSTLTKGEEAESGHTRTVRHVSWSPCDNYLASASFDATVIIWRVNRSAEEKTLELQSIAILEGHANEVKCVAWATSGNLLATCGRDKSVWIWEFDEEEDFQCVCVLQPHSADVKSVFWHPFKQILGSTSYDNTINLYKEELDDWVVACKLVGHESTVWKAAFSPSGEYLASASDDKIIRLWREQPGQKPFHWICFRIISDRHTATILDLAWSPCGGYLASCGSDDSIIVFRLTLPHSANSCSDVLSKVGEITVWQSIAKAHKGDVNSISWHPKLGSPKIEIERGKTAQPAYLLASGGDDRLIHLWSIDLDPDCVDSIMATGDASMETEDTYLGVD